MEPWVCRRCGNCCRIEGEVVVTPAECEAISGFLQLDLEKFMAEFVALSADRRQLVLAGEPTSPCRFLSEDSGVATCRIQPVKPAQCRNFPRQWNYPGWEKRCGKKQA